MLTLAHQITDCPSVAQAFAIIPELLEGKTDKKEQTIAPGFTENAISCEACVAKKILIVL